MLLAELVAASDAVAATPARLGKIALLAAALRAAGPAEVRGAVGVLSGDPRQGKVGVGWATLAAIRASPAPEPSLTLADLDHTLDRIASTTGSGSTAAREAVLHAFLSRATAQETDFLRRLFVGELRQGALEGVLLEAVARAAGVKAAAVRRALLLAGDLGVVAEVALRAGEHGLAAVGLEVLRPLKPMLASPAASVGDALGELGTASVEWKLDGARVQAHRRGDDVQVFTRNLNDVTARLPELVTIVRGLPSNRFVLDGEVIGLDDDARPRPFQDTMSGFGRDDHTARTISLRPAFFDVLHLDGEDLVDRPLLDRLDALAQVAGPWQIPGIVTADAEEAAAFLDRAIAAGHEGVMVKALDAVYDAGRRGKAWRKVKPVRTFDLVVLAAEWGHGRRRGWLSNLHLGARDGVDGGFVMVGKTFKGLTDELLRWQTERFLSLEIARDASTVHLRPEQVVEVALDGVQVSSRYPGGVALRFARVKRYRDDKGPDAADTVQALRALLPGRG